MLAAICNAFGQPMDEIRLSDDEAHRIAKALVNVEKHYRIPSIPDDKMALGMLCVTAFQVYGPKVIAIHARLNAPVVDAEPAPVTVSDTVQTYVPPETGDPAGGWFGTGDPGTGLH